MKGVFTVVAAGLLGATLAVPAWAQQPGATPDRMASMRSKMEKKAADAKAVDARLDELLKTMDGANGPAKTEAMSALLHELVASKKAMTKKMAECEMMMGHGAAGEAKGDTQDHDHSGKE